MDYEVEGVTPKGRSKKTWSKVVENDCRAWQQCKVFRSNSLQHHGKVGEYDADKEVLCTEVAGEFSGEAGTVSHWALRRGTGNAQCWARRSRQSQWQTYRQVEWNEMFVWTDDAHEVKLEQQQASDVLSDTAAVALNVTYYLLSIYITHTHCHGGQLD